MSLGKLMGFCLSTVFLLCSNNLFSQTNILMSGLLIDGEGRDISQTAFLGDITTDFVAEEMPATKIAYTLTMAGMTKTGTGTYVFDDRPLPYTPQPAILVFDQDRMTAYKIILEEGGSFQLCLDQVFSFSLTIILEENTYTFTSDNLKVTSQAPLVCTDAS